MVPGNIPTHKCYVMAGKLYDTYAGNFAPGYLCSKVKKLLRTGEFGMVPSVGEGAVMGFDWEATLKVSSDAQFYYENE